MGNIVIPQTIQIVIDDLGWFCGDDDRAFGGASRSGMPRRHNHKDYEAIEELGKRLDMKIFCAFVMGEWDPDNRLRCFPRMSKYGKDWDNVSFLDKAEAEKCAEVIRNSKYIDVALHGLGHGYYMEGVDNTDSSDYYYSIKKELFLADEKEVRARIEKFFELVEYYRFNKEVTGFVPPSGTYRWNELSNILADYGIKYVSEPFRRFKKCSEPNTPDDIGFENRMITIERYKDLVAWNEYDPDFDNLKERPCTFGSHWPNWLHLDPDRNMEVIEKAVRYFNRCAENIDALLSRDMKFSVTQTFYWKKSKVSVNENGETMIDISDVPKHKDMNSVFYVNSTDRIEWSEGCEIKVYGRKKDFITYEITPRSDIIKLR